MKVKENFLPHLYEPFRRRIATRYVQHEMRKFLPQLRRASVWRSIDEQIREWHKKLGTRNFWNCIHGISMGFRLKSLVPWITSLHVRWTEKNVPIDDLWFGGKFGPIASLETSESAAAVKKHLFRPKNRKILEQTQKKLRRESIDTAPRDNFPIFVVRKDHDKLRVIDGNRRLLQAIVFGKHAIRAVVGETIAEPPFYEHWVPTQILVDLVFWYKRQVSLGRDTTKATARVVAELICDSSAARSEFARWGSQRNGEVPARLFKMVAKTLANYGVSLKI